MLNLSFKRFRSSLRPLGCVVVSAALLSGCADMPNMLNSMADSISKLGTPGVSPDGKFAQSGLADVFVNNGDGKSWPRVALTIEKMPADAAETWLVWPRGGGTPQARNVVPARNFCFTMSATVWNSPTRSQQFDHVEFCGSDIQPGGITNDYHFYLLGWASLPKTTLKNTGNSRTNGPNPPAKSFPSRSIIVDSSSTKAGLMFAYLVNSLGLDWTEDYRHEARLWVVRTPS